MNTDQNQNRKRLRHGFIQFRQGELAEKTKDWIDRTADALDEKLSRKVEGSSLEVPVLSGEPQPLRWYRIPLTEGMAADGSGYHIYLRRGTSPRLCIFFSGGGLAWNEFTAARPITAGALLSGKPNFYYSNLRPVTQWMNVGSGIMEISGRNPFNDWNFIVVTYATGDFHIGRSEYHYADTDGKDHILHFHGYANFQAAMQQAVRFFPDPASLLIGGDSAGGFAVPALAPEIADVWYPACHDITLLSDASLLCYSGWKHTVRDLWKAAPEMYECIRSENLTFEWYRRILTEYPGRFRCLYCGSTHDYVLSTYYNDAATHTFQTNAEIREQFYLQLSGMVFSLLRLDPGFKFMIHDLQSPVSHGGTIHTAVRRGWFYAPAGGTTIARWLRDAVFDDGINVGLALLHHD